MATTRMKKHCLNPGHLGNLFEEGQQNTRFQLSLPNSPLGWKTTLEISRTLFPELKYFPSVYCISLKDWFTRIPLCHTHRTEVPGVHWGPIIHHAHAAILCPKWGLSKCSHPPGEENVSHCNEPCSLEGSLTTLWSAAGSNAKLSFSWAPGGCLEPQLYLEAARMEDTQVATPQPLRLLLLLFHYQWKDKLSFHLTTHPGLFVTNFCLSALRDGALSISRCIATLSHGLASQHSWLLASLLTPACDHERFEIGIEIPVKSETIDEAY